MVLLAVRICKQHTLKVYIMRITFCVLPVSYLKIHLILSRLFSGVFFILGYWTCNDVSNKAVHLN